MPADDLGPPIVPGYELVRIIGRGGMGVVWEAIEHRLERRVAVKVRRPEMASYGTAQIWSEARLAAKVADPGVVAVHDIGTTLDGRPYHTMDLIEGSDLTALLREGPLSQSRSLAIGAQIARAASAAHERGIAHTDLKPANVLIDPKGRARVLDFGLAHGGSRRRPLPEHRLRHAVVHVSRAGAHGTGRPHQCWSWRLRAHPAKLWPLVANTERVNRAIGLPEVESCTRAARRSSFTRSGSSRGTSSVGWR